MSSFVHIWEIVFKERLFPSGKRKTVFNCDACSKPLTESELSIIRMSKLPCKHYNCLGKVYD